jgi:hypothetical protein
MNNVCMEIYLGENTVKRARATKVKVFFQGLHMTRVVFVLVYNFFLKKLVPL